MDKAEVRLRSPLYGFITLLLSHNELLDQASLVWGAHVFRLCSSADPVVHLSEHSGLREMWVESQHPLQQHPSIDPFIYCEEEQEFRSEESDEHPKHLEEKATSGGVTFDGYVKVQSAPYANDQGAKTERDDPEGAPLLWFSLPQVRGVARRGGIGWRITHLFGGSVEMIDPAK